MRSKLLSTTMGIMLAGAALSASGAFAADLPSMQPAPMAPVMTHYNWSGFYLGAFGGASYSDPALTGGYCEPSDGGYCYNEVTGNADAKFGGLVGGTVGYNMQMGSLVYGLEGDYAGEFGGTQKNLYESYSSGDQYGYGVKTDSAFTIRGRAGIAFDRTLLYVTAGFAEIHNRTKTFDGTSGYSGSSQWTPALAIGGGIEYAIADHWTIKAEGLYLAAATSKSNIPVPGESSSDYYGVTKTTPSQAILKLGINYKF